MKEILLIAIFCVVLESACSRPPERSNNATNGEATHRETDAPNLSGFSSSAIAEIKAADADMKRIYRFALRFTSGLKQADLIRSQREFMEFRKYACVAGSSKECSIVATSVRADLLRGIVADATMTPSVRVLTRKASGAFADCRGGGPEDPESMRGCNRMVRLGTQLEKLGWCWGGGGDSEIAKQWIRCSDDREPITARNPEDKKPIYSAAEIALAERAKHGHR